MKATCSHLNVTYANGNASGDTVPGYWVCVACGERFEPCARKADRTERNYQLLQAAATMGVGVIGSAAQGGVSWIVPATEAIERAEYMLQKIEVRNAPHVPIKDSGF